jgi:hypothetical protein
MQTDQRVYRAGLNLYAYVRNDPFNGIEPTGLEGAPPPPELGLFAAAGLPNGPEDFKNIFGHDSTGYLGAAGNFAYGAVASGVDVSQITAEFGAGAYATGIKRRPHFSNPSWEDSSAAKFLPAGYATNGRSTGG